MTLAASPNVAVLKGLKLRNFSTIGNKKVLPKRLANADAAAADGDVTTGAGVGEGAGAVVGSAPARGRRDRRARRD